MNIYASFGNHLNILSVVSLNTPEEGWMEWFQVRGKGRWKGEVKPSIIIYKKITVTPPMWSHTQHPPHRSLTLCPLHTKEHDRKRYWADSKIHPPYSDGQPVHPYEAGVAHTHHPRNMMPPSEEYIHPVKISAYHTNVPYNPTPVVHKPV